MLKAAGACPEGVALVRQHFGSRPLRLTRARLQKAARLGLNADWLSQHLTAYQRRVYGVAMAEPWQVYHAAAVEAWRARDASYAVAAWRVHRLSEVNALADALGLP